MRSDEKSCGFNHNSGQAGGAVRALAGLRNVEYPENLFEVLVAEGTCPSRQRNQAACEALGEILYFQHVANEYKKKC